MLLGGERGRIDEEESEEEKPTTEDAGVQAFILVSNLKDRYVKLQQQKDSLTIPR